MCGLVGAHGQQISREQALAAIAHRGPDDSGWVEIGGSTFGHTRLAIQDLDPRSACPFVSGPITLTYNGEIWNAAELRKPAGDRHAPWRTTGDTEVVARQLARFGYRGLDRLDGMFAVAWYDTTGAPQRHGTWLARDRYGKIPLYAVRAGTRWRWASEIKALPRSIPAVAIEPGTAVHLESGKVYPWATQAEPPDANPRTLAGLLERAVHKRLISDRPIAFLLSGGLDSSLILAIAAHRVPDLTAYTAVYDRSSPDLVAARRVAGEMGVKLIEVPVPQPDRRAVFDAVRAIEIPLKAQVEIALGCLPLARAIAADGFRVVLSGEAADEIFGGYGNMIIAGSRADDEGWREIRRAQLAKMARGNFVRVNKIFMAAGVEARLPYMDRKIVDLALAATKQQCPPGKKLLQYAAADFLPPAVIKRPKETFQGAAGLTAAAAALIRNPTVYYHAQAREIFGYLPKG